MNERHFSQLLLVLVLLYFGGPLVSGLVDGLLPWLKNAVYSIGIIFTVLAAAFITSGNRKRLIFVMGAALTAVVCKIGHMIIGGNVLLIASHMIMAAVLAVVVATIVVYMFRVARVTHYTIYGSLCAYLLMALLWAVLYSIVGTLDPGAFRIPETAGAAGSVVQSFDGLYFSLVTLTTVGYGDITPVSIQAKMLATGEALFGQVYLVVTVARLVSVFSSTTQHGNQS